MDYLLAYIGGAASALLVVYLGYKAGQGKLGVKLHREKAEQKVDLGEALENGKFKGGVLHIEG